MPFVKTKILAIATAAAESSGALAKGRYRLTSSTDCWLKQGPTGMAAAAAGGANCFFLAKGEQAVMTVSDGTTDAFISGIRLSADGHLSIATIED